MKTSPRKRNPTKEKLPESLVSAAYRLQKPSVRPLAVGDVVRCYEDPVTEQQTEGDCILMSKVGAGDDGREMWRVRFAADGIEGPSFTRSVHVRNRYNNAEEVA